METQLKLEEPIEMSAKEHLLLKNSLIPDHRLVPVHLDIDGKDVKTTYLSVIEVNGETPICIVTPQYSLDNLKEINERMINSFENIKDGLLFYFYGTSLLHIYPEEINPNGSEFEIGLSFLNSVNTETTREVKYVVKCETGHTLILPRQKTFRKIHKGKKGKIIIEDYIGILKDFAPIWRVIYEKLNAKRIDSLDDFLDICHVIEFDVKIKEEMQQRFSTGVKMNLWELFLRVYDIIAERNFKNEINKRKRLSEWSESVMNEAFIRKLE